jgi:hypothetical protein
MADKVCVIITNRDRDVIKWALRYARRNLECKFLEDVKVIALGPSEKVITEDLELQELVKSIQAQGHVLRACKACSEEEGISDKLEELGFLVEYVGETISKLIKDDYLPMTW